MSTRTLPVWPPKTTSIFASPTAVPSGSGHGTFAFGAVQQPDGTTVGDANIDVVFGGQTGSVRVDIDCVYVPSILTYHGTLSGIVTHAEGLWQGLEGSRILFTVEDTGDPGSFKSGVSDSMSDFNFFAPGTT